MNHRAAHDLQPGVSSNGTKPIRRHRLWPAWELTAAHNTLRDLTSQTEDFAQLVREFLGKWFAITGNSPSDRNRPGWTGRRLTVSGQSRPARFEASGQVHLGSVVFGCAGNGFIEAVQQFEHRLAFSSTSIA